MLVVPPNILELLKIKVGESVNISVDSGRPVVEPNIHKKYTLQELLAECDPSQPLPEGDADWVSAPATGRELL